MTNYERIKQMSVEEMTKMLSGMWDCNDCTEHERLSDNPLLKNEVCDNECFEHCKEWLEKEWIEKNEK